jgi:hypothetical protein
MPRSAPRVAASLDPRCLTAATRCWINTMCLHIARAQREREREVVAGATALMNATAEAHFTIGQHTQTSRRSHARHIANTRQ